MFPTETALPGNSLMSMKNMFVAGDRNEKPDGNPLKQACSRHKLQTWVSLSQGVTEAHL